MVAVAVEVRTVMVAVAVEVKIVTAEAARKLPVPVASKTMTLLTSNQDSPALSSPADRRNSMARAWRTSQCSEQQETLRI